MLVAVVTQQKWMVVVFENKDVCLFTMRRCISGKRRSRDSVKEKDGAYVKLLCNIKAEFVSHQSIVFSCIDKL